MVSPCAHVDAVGREAHRVAHLDLDGSRHGLRIAGDAPVLLFLLHCDGLGRVLLVAMGLRRPRRQREASRISRTSAGSWTCFMEYLFGWLSGLKIEWLSDPVVALPPLPACAPGLRCPGRHAAAPASRRRHWPRSRRLRQRAGPFVGRRARRVPEPARIAVVAAASGPRRTLSMLNMPPISTEPNGPCAGHHRQRVVGQRHLHLGHVGHAALAHHHVVGNELGDLPRHAAVVDADHRRHVVAHRVHRVVALVAVEGPVALLVGDELELRASGRPRCRSSPRASARPSASGRRRCR